jgi:RNA polymerase sigma-70 factor (ECF subfamily)
MVNDKNSERPVHQAAIQPVPPPAAPNVERIFREHATRVLSAAYRVTGSAPDAEDVLQTVFMRLVRREGGTHLDDNPAAYLHRAAVNAALDIVRSRRAARATPLEDAVGGLTAPESGEAHRRLASGELRDEVRKALSGLSPRSAEIFALRYFEGYDNHEIARMLGSSRSTVAVILHRARRHVRDAIRPHTREAGEER